MFSRPYSGSLWPFGQSLLTVGDVLFQAFSVIYEVEPTS